MAKEFRMRCRARWCTPHRSRTTRSAREPKGEPAEKTQESERTGVFTTGIVSEVDEGKIALYRTGRNHAGENLKEIIDHRDGTLPEPIHMCDGLSRNVPPGFRAILSNCLAHARRQFVNQVANFPEECRFVIETLAAVYKNDEASKGMSPEERLEFHKLESGPLMDRLELWLEDELSEKRVEPNSGLGKAINYMLKRWKKLTVFLEVAGAPLDNNVCERALKKAILHRKNSLFYKTENGARVGDIFMSLIHTAELAKEDPFHYLTELLRRPAEIRKAPDDWMPWTYRYRWRSGSRPQWRGEVCHRWSRRTVRLGGCGSAGVDHQGGITPWAWVSPLAKYRRCSSSGAPGRTSPPGSGG